MRIALLVFIGIAAAMALWVLPPITQDSVYHQFADRRTLLGVPNFWNVVSNIPFLAVALWGVRALRSSTSFIKMWERVAYGILLAGVALIAFGSAYYHAWPDNSTLVWDRLPMTIVFMALFATTIGERINMRAGKLLLFPLLVLGIASVIYWNESGDLRPYIFVQFYPLIALPLMLLLFDPRYSGAAGLWGMVGFYALAKVLELYDAQIGSAISTGGHPWKHLAGAAAMWCYVHTVERRKVTEG